MKYVHITKHCPQPSIDQLLYNTMLAVKLVITFSFVHEICSKTAVLNCFAAFWDADMDAVISACDFKLTCTLRMQQDEHFPAAFWGAN